MHAERQDVIRSIAQYGSDSTRKASTEYLGNLRGYRRVPATHHQKSQVQRAAGGAKNGKATLQLAQETKAQEPMLGDWIEVAIKKKEAKVVEWLKNPLGRLNEDSEDDDEEEDDATVAKPQTRQS